MSIRRTLVRAYFHARPLLPRAPRTALRRALAKRTRRRFTDSWPINHLASRPPEWWTGWPEGKKFAFVLTHDVEGMKGVARCRDLAEMEMRLGFRSSFNFVPEGEYQTQPALRDFLTAHGFEVGVQDLHHDGKLYSSPEKFNECAQKINRYLADWGAVGFRSGFMLHNLDWLRRLDILYDASTFDTDPFEPQPDGVNTIFPLWIGGSGRSGYVELPYSLPQDSTLFLVLQESGIETWIRKLDWVASHGGMALLNVHPDYLSFDEQKHTGEYSAKLYEAFLEYVARKYSREAWFALPKAVAAYVREMRTVYRPPNIESSPDDACPATVTSDGLDDSFAWRLHGKRVGMVMYSYYPNDPRPRRAVEALVSRGMKVDLICLAENGGEPRHEITNGVEVLRLPIRRKRGSVFRYGFEYGTFLLCAAAILGARQLTRGYDLVYVHNMPDILVLSGLIPKLFGAKLILDLHDPMPELMTTIFGFQPDARSVRLLKRLEAWSIAFSDAVVTVNRTFAKLFVSRSCPASKMNVVMNSPDNRIFRLRAPCAPVPDVRRADEPFVVMYHGSLVERNGVDLAVQALAYVRKAIPNAELRIYGAHTPFLDEVMSLARDRGLQGAVHYLGVKSLEDLVPTIEDCDVGIIPNHRSAFTEINTPTRIFEYLALGKPVIAPHAAGVCDYFSDDALVFSELGSAEDLAQKVEYVFAHPAEVTEIVRRGQEVYRQHPWAMERLRLTALVAELLRDDAVQPDAPKHAFV